MCKTTLLVASWEAPKLAQALGAQPSRRLANVSRRTSADGTPALPGGKSGHRILTVAVAVAGSAACPLPFTVSPLLSFMSGAWGLGSGVFKSGVFKSGVSVKRPPFTQTSCGLHVEFIVVRLVVTGVRVALG